MRSIRRTLVAIKDPASNSQLGTTKAVQLARGLGAKLECFHAITSPLYADLYDQGWKKAERNIQTEILRMHEVLAHRLGGRGEKISVATEWDFPAYEAVVRRANRIKADLVVAERHAGRYFAPWLLHLNDRKLLRLCPMPVLLIKSVAAYRSPIVLAAVDPTHSEKPASLDPVILRTGALVSGALRGKLHAMYAHVSVLSGTHDTDAFNPSTAARLNSQFVAVAKAQLDRLLKSTRIPPSRRRLNGSDPAGATKKLPAQSAAKLLSWAPSPVLDSSEYS